MSKPVNPLVIGSFTLGALLLLIIGIFIFGGRQLLNTDPIRFVIFFDSSLNGLEVGAPVKMQGVKIGEVTEIALQLDTHSTKIYKPVVVAIDRNALSSSNGDTFSKALSYKDISAKRDKLVAAGFRARLEMQSLLTGLLYVDFDVHPDKPPLFAKLEYQGLLEIPGIPTTSDEIRNTAEQVAKKLRALPLDEIVGDFASTLKEIKNLLASDDVKNSRVALAKTLLETEKIMGTLNHDLQPLLSNTNKTLQDTRLLVQDSRTMVQALHQDLDPVLASTHQTLLAATAALNRADKTMASVNESLGPESALTETLDALKNASRSLNDLTDYLERHPESLISGKAN